MRSELIITKVCNISINFNMRTWRSRLRYSLGILRNEDIDEIIEEDFIGLGICGSGRLESICWHAERILLKRMISRIRFPRCRRLSHIEREIQTWYDYSGYWTWRNVHSACTRDVQRNSRLATWNFSCGAFMSSIAVLLSSLIAPNVTYSSYFSKCRSAKFWKSRIAKHGNGGNPNTEWWLRRLTSRSIIFRIQICQEFFKRWNEETLCATSR